MDTATTPQEAARIAIRLLGGPSQAARVLNVKEHRHQTVQSWLRHRVPAEYCPDIEAETRARGAVVPCERLRPDVGWGRIRGHAPPADAAGAGEAQASTGELDGQEGGEAVHGASLGAAPADRVASQTAEELV